MGGFLNNVEWLILINEIYRIDAVIYIVFIILYYKFMNLTNLNYI